MSEIDDLISDLLRRDRKNWKFHFFELCAEVGDGVKG